MSLYSPPNEYLLQKSHTTLAVCRYPDEGALVVIDAKSILSVVVTFGFRRNPDVTELKTLKSESKSGW